MDYKLCIFLEDEKSFKIIDLSNLFSSKKEALNLKYIDKFTMSFKDEDEFKGYLLSKGIITKEQLSMKLGITYVFNIPKFIPIFYSNKKRTMEKLENLSSEIKSYFDSKRINQDYPFSYNSIMGDYRNITGQFEIFKTMSEDIDFLRDLQEYVKKNPNQEKNIDDINTYINSLRNYHNKKFIYIALFETFRNIFYRYDQKSKTLKLNYKGFRDFTSFYYEYNKKFKRKIEISKVEEYDSSDILADYPIPYASIEEIQEFQNYLEQLPDEEHPHRYR